jgi:hypothetical protein
MDYAVTEAAHFSALRGHVAQGTQVLMPSGQFYEVRATLRGWQVFADGRPVSDANLSAMGVECFIVATSSAYA